MVQNDRGAREADRRVVKFRDRSWGKVFTLSVIKPPKVDPQMYGRSTTVDYQKNWDLGLAYQNLAFAMRRDEEAHQHNLLRWMIYGSISTDISDAGIGAMNSLMCVSFILRRLQPLIRERSASDRSYNVCFRPKKTALNDLHKEVEDARDFDLYISAARDEYQFYQPGTTCGRPSDGEPGSTQAG